MKSLRGLAGKYDWSNPCWDSKLVKDSHRSWQPSPNPGETSDGVDLACMIQHGGKLRLLCFPHLCITQTFYGKEHFKGKSVCWISVALYISLYLYIWVDTNDMPLIGATIMYFYINGLYLCSSISYICIFIDQYLNSTPYKVEVVIEYEQNLH